MRSRSAAFRDTFLRTLAAALVGGAGAALLSVLTSRGYLHATVVTGAGYTGHVEQLGPGEQALMIVAWIAVGAAGGYVGRSPIAFAGLWLGAFAGSVLGFLSDPEGNILWLDVTVTVVGVTLFLVPGFLLGIAIAAWRDRLAPDGSGRRPTPPPLWTRGGSDRTRTSGPAAPPAPSAVSKVAAPSSGTSGAYPSSAYARPGSQAPDSRS